jgi:Tfp pilus assembly protein PilN
MEAIMFGRLQLYIIAGIFLFGVLTAGYYSWRSGIEREALLEYNQQQLEQSIKDKAAMEKQIADIDNVKREVEAKNEAEKKAFKEKLESIGLELSSKQVADSDRPASKVLKDTVNKLKDVVK